MPIFSEHIIGIGPLSESGYLDYLRQFVSDPVIKQVFEKRNEVYPDLVRTVLPVHQAIERYQQAIGDPKSITITGFISGFNQSFLALENELAIGLDNYLGAETQFYHQLRLPEYVIQTMTPEYLIPDAVRAWIMSDLPDVETENLLDKMIREGILLYLTLEFLKGTPENLVFRYTESELDWCLKNEKSMWQYLVGEQLLFSSDRLMIHRLTEEAPFTREFGHDSPGRTGNWIGYQIVRKFMARKKASVQDLLTLKNMQQVLSESGYQP